jgi:hypothetical protein
MNDELGDKETVNSTEEERHLPERKSPNASPCEWTLLREAQSYRPKAF